MKIANNKLQIVSVPWKSLETLVFVFSFVLLLAILMLRFGLKVKASQEMTTDIAGHFETPFVPYNKEMVAGPNKQLFLVDGGLFKSNNDGHFWFDISNNKGIDTIALSPNFIQDQTFFVGLKFDRYDALRITTDGGRSWHSPSEPIPGNVNQITVSPAFTQDNTVFAKTFDGDSKLIKSQDGGNTWQTLTISPSTVFPLSITISPSFASDRTLLLTVSQNGVIKLMRSNDAGDTWSFFPLVLDPDDEFSYMMTPAFSPDYQNDNILFLHTSPYDNLYKSEDDGQSWHKINKSGKCI